MTDDEIIEVVKAHKEGKKIVCREMILREHGQWLTVATDDGVGWNFSEFRYRVAPEPRKPREWWTTVATLVGAKHAVGDACLPIKVREVID